MLPLLNLVQRHASGGNISVRGQGREGERVGRGGMVGEKREVSNDKPNYCNEYYTYAHSTSISI